MAGFGNASEQLKQFWSSRTGAQKGFLVGGTAATLLLMVLFVRMIGSPDYKPLFTGLEPADAQALTAQLDAQGIPHQTSVDGKTISVPADKLDVARMQTASQDQPHSGRMGFELFDKMSWGQTEFDEKVTYQRALEGELERSIETLADVESARVHLVLPTDSVFMDRQRGAKASVILKLRRGELSKGAVMAISRLVSGAVDNLAPEDVSIIDADSARALGLSHTGPDNSDGQGATLSERLINTLEPIVGANNIRANVNVDYDQGTTDESQEKYDPAVSVLLTDQKSEDQAGGSSVPAGVPGTASNIPKPNADKNPPAPTATQSSKTESATYGVNKTITHTVTPAGRVARITAAILVDDAMVRTVTKGKVSYTPRKRSQEELDKIRNLAEAAIGFDAKRGDTITVENLPFNTDVTNIDLPAPTWTTKVQKTVTDYSSILRPVALLALFALAWLFVLRPVQKHVLSTPQLAAPKQAALPDPQSQVLTAATMHELGAGTARAAQLKEQTVELIKQKPVHTARAVQAWLREEPS
ncbi:MAG: flagellar basal-body MS-ring/collar protein FliF [Acidobacteriota bacterium]